MSKPKVKRGSRGYRPNVGVALFNTDGRVFMGRRVNSPPPYCWQMPQGGIDGKEVPLAAARRELYEETGVRSIEYLGEIPGWITYDFPDDFRGSKAARGFKGQRQRWFAFRFTGNDSEVDLEAHGEVEFCEWRWMLLEETPHHIVPFKRDVYAEVIAAFGHYATPLR